MKRREFVERLGFGATALIAGPTRAGHPAPRDTKQNANEHDHRPISGPLATTTVSFGAWQTDPPLSRFPNVSPAARNQHQQVPGLATIKAGGTVNYIIAGLHQIVVYGPGTRPEDINAGLTTPTTGTPAGLALINDPANRVYFGLDPSLLPRDRVEVVHFQNPPLSRHLRRSIPFRRWDVRVRQGAGGRPRLRRFRMR